MAVVREKLLLFSLYLDDFNYKKYVKVWYY